jgi:hypothetical protein
MITQDIALRLYKVPKRSQLLKRIGSKWYSLSLNTSPLPTPNRKSSKTTLHMLMAKVSATGPHIEPFPRLPKDAPSWNGRVQVIPKQKDWDYQQVTTMLTNTCHAGNLTNIYCNGVISNRNHTNNKQIRAILLTVQYD